MRRFDERKFPVTKMYGLLSAPFNGLAIAMAGMIERHRTHGPALLFGSKLQKKQTPASVFSDFLKGCKKDGVLAISCGNTRTTTPTVTHPRDLCNLSCGVVGATLASVDLSKLCDSKLSWRSALCRNSASASHFLTAPFRFAQCRGGTTTR